MHRAEPEPSIGAGSLPARPKVEASAWFWNDKADFRSRHDLRLPALLLAVLLAAQLYLVFFKSFNWDEFLHFSQVYQAREGTLNQPFQVLHARILWWAPELAGNLIDQMRFARLFMWGAQFLTLFMIFGLARQFTSFANSFFASFAYLTAGYVFQHGFAIRADPLATASLMTALFLLGKGNLAWPKAIAIGVLIGLAGMMTLKSVFYVPCFAGLAWLKFCETPDKRQLVARVAVLSAGTLASFAAIYLYHRSGLAPVPERFEGGSLFAHGVRWFSAGIAPRAAYIGQEIKLAFIFMACIVLAPPAWRRAGIGRNRKIALIGLCLPLIVLLFYRNAFPYFFVFILAPVAVAIAPALGMIRERYGNAVLAIGLSIVPLFMAITEPRHVLVRQRALINYVHQEFPEKTGYLGHAGMIADYPRILNHLTSGVGIASYHERGDAIVAREIDAGRVPFVIANHKVIAAGLEGAPLPDTFLPADLAAMRTGYVRQWGALWREGTEIPAGTGVFEFSLRRRGSFTLSGDSVTVDGRAIAHGTTIVLDAGVHAIAGGRESASVLWRGENLPATPPDVPPGMLFTNF